MQVGYSSFSFFEHCSTATAPGWFLGVDGCRWGSLQFGYKEKKYHRGCWCMRLATMHYSKTECSKKDVPDSHWRMECHHELSQSAVILNTAQSATRKLSFKYYWQWPFQIPPRCILRRGFYENTKQNHLCEAVISIYCYRYPSSDAAEVLFTSEDLFTLSAVDVS